MSHPDFEARIDAQLDGELGADEARLLEGHLGQCAECARFREQRQRLRAAIAAAAPVYPAPDTLRQRVKRAVTSAASSTRRLSVSSLVRGGVLAASLVLVAFGGWVLGARRATDAALVDEVLASHIRSLQPGHLTDVRSTEQHTVKPWFNGRIDFSPPVHDLAAEGFPLLGGRLDYVAGRAVAVLVYGRRQHVINVFVWPAPSSPGTGGVGIARVQQGYSVIRRSTPDFAIWIVSDVNGAELEEFARLLRESE